MGLFDFLKPKKQGVSKIVISTIPAEEKEEPIKYAEDGRTETDAFNYLAEQLVLKGADKSKFKVENHSDNYLTLVYDNNDLIRLKYSALAKWISIPVSANDRKNYIDSDLFSAQRNKNEYFWKSNFYSFEDLDTYIPLLENSIKQLEEYKMPELTDEERIVCDYVKDGLLKLGAEDKYIYYHKYQNSEVVFQYGFSMVVRFRLGKKVNYLNYLDSEIQEKEKKKIDKKGRYLINNANDVIEIIDKYNLIQKALENEGDRTERYINNGYRLFGEKY